MFAMTNNFINQYSHQTSDQTQFDTGAYVPVSGVNQML